MFKFNKKSRIRETKHLLTDADSCTNAIGGWTKNTPKPDFFLNGKNHPQHKNSKTSSGSVVSTIFCWKKNTPKPNFFENWKKNHPKRKN